MTDLHKVKKVDLDVNELFHYLLANGTIEPSQIVFTEYDTVYSSHQFLIITFSLILAVLVLLLRYTIHNKEDDQVSETNFGELPEQETSRRENWRRVKNTWLYQVFGWLFERFNGFMRCFSNPFHCLAVLWFFVTTRYLYELDLLRTLPGNSAMRSYGRARKPTVFD